jgi:MFS family permease
MAVSPPAALAPLRQDPDFRRYWAARMTSVAGSMVTYVALPVLVYQVTGSNLWTGLVAVSEAAPYLLLGLFAGAIADRRDRRRMMVAADLASAAVLLSIPLAYAMDALTAPHVLVAAFVAQSLFVFFDAANNGALPALAGRERLAPANSAVAGGGTAIEVTVPALAGALLVLIAPAPMIALDALSFVASALLIRGIAAPLRGEPGAPGYRLRADIAEGLRFLFRNRLIRVMTLLGCLTNLGVAAFIGQLVPWMDQVLGVSPGGDARFGVIWAVMGFGGLGGSVVFPVVARRLGTATMALLALPLSTAAAVGCALTGHWLAAAAATGAWYCTYMMVGLASITLRQSLTPDRMMARVNTTARMLAFGIGWPAGALLGSVLSEAHGPTASIWAGAATMAVATGVAWLSPLRRRPGSAEERADRLTQVDPADRLGERGSDREHT